MTMNRQELIQAIDRLPENVLSEIAQFIEYLEFRAQRDLANISSSGADTPYKPVRLPANVIAEVDFTSDYIAEARKELWANFGESHL